MGTPPVTCGAIAKEHLAQLVTDKQMICWAPDKLGAETWPPSPMRPLNESFGLVIVQCRAIDATGRGIDIAEQMITDGWAIQFQENEAHTPNYFAVAEGARSTKQGVWYTCTLKPEAWRDEDERAVFVAKNNVPTKDLIGHCGGLLHPPGPA